MTALVTFREFRPADMVEISGRLSEDLLRIGLTENPASIEEGEQLAAAGPAWTAVARDGRILCCAGFAEVFPGVQAEAWATLATTIGPAHLAITRFARWQVKTSPLFRIDARCIRRRAEVTWARLCGFREWAELGPWGPRREPTMLFSRIRPMPEDFQ